MEGVKKVSDLGEFMIWEDNWILEAREAVTEVSLMDGRR